MGCDEDDKRTLAGPLAGFLSFMEGPGAFDSVAGASWDLEAMLGLQKLPPPASWRPLKGAGAAEQRPRNAWALAPHASTSPGTE